MTLELAVQSLGFPSLDAFAVWGLSVAPEDLTAMCTKIFGLTNSSGGGA